MKIPSILLLSAFTALSPVHSQTDATATAPTSEDSKKKGADSKKKAPPSVGGKIDSFDPATNKLVIKKGKTDSSFDVTADTKVIDETGAAGSLANLQKGTRVTVIAAADGTTAQEIKVLPPKGGNKKEGQKPAEQKKEEANGAQKNQNSSEEAAE